MSNATIQHDGYHWEVLATGIVKDPKPLTYLASITQGKENGNCWYPRQITDWIDTDKLREAGVQL